VFDLVVAQIQRREVVEVIEVLDSVDEVVVQVEFEEGRRETSVYSCDLVVPQSEFLG
jgi:N-acetylglutamate synthase/N-acetylornithine aminotransferase